jgi:hypothetical protein
LRGAGWPGFTIQEKNGSRGECVVTRFEKPAEFGDAYTHAAPSAPAIKTLALLAALLAYSSGFVFLYPIVASSVAKSVSEGNDPALMQFVAP